MSLMETSLQQPPTITSGVKGSLGGRQEEEGEGAHTYRMLTASSQPTGGVVGINFIMVPAAIGQSC